ncbi:MAG: nucleotide exchange factor GrpE [Actinomycetaceae bacterium]|nr:nucleotide exchange factor GrpE [Actinomycetaceae bacterium]
MTDKPQNSGAHAAPEPSDNQPNIAAQAEEFLKTTVEDENVAVGAGADAPEASTAAASAVGSGTQNADAGESADAANLEKSEETTDETSAEEIIGQLGDDLARAKADIYNLNSEYQNYVRRSKQEVGAHRKAGQAEVMESLLSVLDDIHAAREHGDLQEGPFAAIATKLEDALKSGFGLERYGTAGEVFDPNIHDALMASESAEVTEPTIAQVLQPGYRTAEKVLRPTKVMVSNPA